MDDIRAPGEAPDWDRLKRDVCVRIDYLAACWAHTAAASPQMHEQLFGDLYLPAVRLLAEFCACVEVDVEVDVEI